MQRLVTDRLAFLKALDEAKKPKPNKTIVKYINRWISRSYGGLVDSICWNFSIVRDGGMCAFDRLNDCIINIYNDHSLHFKNQSECDLYMEKELNYRRFIISVRAIK